MGFCLYNKYYKDHEEIKVGLDDVCPELIYYTQVMSPSIPVPVKYFPPWS